MGITQANFYFIKALDNYAYNFTESIEALNFALSYDEEHAGAHCLMGRLCMEYLDKFDEAAVHFKRALFYDPGYNELYIYYINLLLLTEDFDNAEKMIEKALLVKGIDKAKIYYRLAQLFERKKMYPECKANLINGIDFCYDNEYTSFLTAEINRIKSMLGI